MFCCGIFVGNQRKKRGRKEEGKGKETKRSGGVKRQTTPFTKKDMIEKDFFWKKVRLAKIFV